MNPLFTAIFSLELALLFTHEMDAIRKKEWKMFIVLKDMGDEKAYLTFVLLHIPLYMAILFLLLSDYIRIGLYITDIFLVLHMLVHFSFRNHKSNNLNSRVSKAIIYSAGLLAAFHLIATSI